MMALGVGGHGRKVFKTWGIVFSCLASKAVALWLAASYSKKDFMICLDKQTAIYGAPRYVVSDQGSQLVAAQKDLKVWDEIEEEAKERGIVWEFVPAGTPWRNGLAERCVALAKHTLSHVVDKHDTLPFTELEGVLLRVAAILNERPLDARLYDDDVFHPVCPRDLLLGRISGYFPGGHPDWTEEVDLRALTERVSLLTQAWWREWEDKAFPLLCPRVKWTRERRNLREGDIVLLKTEHKLGKPEFRLARVIRTLPDEEGNVRTVELALHTRRGRSREPAERCRLPMEKVTMAVQRLAVILPVEESWERGLTS